MAKKFFRLLDSLFNVVLSENEKCVRHLRPNEFFPPNEFFGQSDSLACKYLVAVYLARVEMPSISSG